MHWVQPAGKLGEDRRSIEMDVDESSVLAELSDMAEVVSAAPGAHDGDHLEKKQAKGGWPKGKRRKKLKDENAPKQPLSGYLRFLNERRDELRAQKTSMTFAEMSKLLGAEWSHMAPADKQRYLDDAERDRQRYQRELDAYHLTDTYKLFRQKLDKSAGCGAVETADAAAVVGGESAFEIPIFTEEFMAHNKSREAELRQLRRQNTELEESNAVLSKHIDNMKAAVEKLQVEAVQQRNTNLVLQEHLDTLRATLATHFAGISLPGASQAVTADNIDTFMARLHCIIIDTPHEHEALIASIRDTVARLNLHDLHKL